MAKLVARLPGFESRHLSIIQNGRHKQRRGQHTLARQKKIQIKYFKDDMPSHWFLSFSMFGGVQSAPSIVGS